MKVCLKYVNSRAEDAVTGRSHLGSVAILDQPTHHSNRSCSGIPPEHGSIHTLYSCEDLLYLAPLITTPVKDFILA